MKKIITLCGVILVLSSCGSSKTLYSWYDYEDLSYKYMKTPTEEVEKELSVAYNRAIHQQKGIRGVVPPGIFAEKGYLYLKAGKIEEGITFLKKEIALYPESEKFLSRVIKKYEE